MNHFFALHYSNTDLLIHGRSSHLLDSRVGLQQYCPNAARPCRQYPKLIPTQLTSKTLLISLFFQKLDTITLAVLVTLEHQPTTFGGAYISRPLHAHWPLLMHLVLLLAQLRTLVRQGSWQKCNTMVHQCVRLCG